METQTYAELMDKKPQPKATTLADFIEGGHQDNEGRELEKPLEKPIAMPPCTGFVDRKDVLRSIRMKEVEKDGKKLMSVSVFYDLEGREIPMDELESTNHEAEHWLTYLGMALWQLSRVKGVENGRLEAEPERP